MRLGCWTGPLEGARTESPLHLHVQVLRRNAALLGPLALALGTPLQGPRDDPPAALSGLEDASERVFGGEAAWRDDLARPFDELAGSIQRELHPGWAAYHGLAVGDVDGDGREDLYVCQPGGLPNRLFVQRADGSAVECAAELRLDWLDATAAALFADFDGDGDPDLAAAEAGALVILENRDFEGAPRFGVRAVLPATGPSSLCAADFDRDGDLDLFAAASDAAWDPERFPEPALDAHNGCASRLYRAAIEAERWSFVDVALEVGLGELFGYASTASFADSDGDGDGDLFVADACGPLRFFENQDGRFREATAGAGLGGLVAVHSLAWADVDRDGREELCAVAPSSAGGIVWLDPDPTGRFSEMARLPRLDGGPFPLGAIAGDLDGDGWTDLAVVGGLARGDPSRVGRALEGRHAELQYERAGLDYRRGFEALLGDLRAGGALFPGRDRAWLGSARFGTPEPPFAEAAGLGFDRASDGRALVALDWNRDGAIDLAATARSAPRLALYLNRPPKTPGLALRLVDRGANRDAIGAEVELVLGEARTGASVRAGGGFLAQSSLWLHFALPPELARGLAGDLAGELRADVRWPDGTRESFAGLEPGRFLLVRGSGPGSGPSMAETAPETRLARRAADAPRPRQAPPSEALLLAAPIPLPELPATDAEGARQTLGGAAPRARLVALGDSAAETAPHAALLAAREELEHLGLDVVALDGERLAPADWPWPWLAPLGETRAALELAARAAFERHAVPSADVAYLIDSAGRLRAVYRGGLDKGALLRHCELLDAAPDVLRDAAVPFAGRWRAAPPPADLAWLAARFQAAGLATEARELLTLAYESRREFPGVQSTELALVRLRQGDPEEAARLLSEAAELAPDWWLPELHLGRALAALGESAAAARAFERALHARPLDRGALAGLARAFAELGLNRPALELEELVESTGALEAPGSQR